jgi:hypothetical protein
MGRSLKTQEFKPTWTTRKEIKNKPVNAITIFLPTAEVKNCDHFISYQEGLKNFGKGKPRSSKTRIKIKENEIDSPQSHY